MQFDARNAKLLPPGSHLTIDDCPGLRLIASESGRTWTYRYKSPVDGRMRQIKIGQWPEMSAAAAIVQWEGLKRKRDAGQDPAAEKRKARHEAIAATQAKKERSVFTVRKLCDGYLTGHVMRHRKAKGAAEIERMFNTMLGELAEVAAAEITRSQAFDLLESYSERPVQGAKLRAELGAAWDYALDAGRLPESTPNWWRQIMRGRLRSQGKKIQGASIGAVKRVLSDAEVGDLVRWLPNFTETVADALALYLWTCTRGSEIMAMAANEITEEADGLWWTVPKEKTKNARHAGAADLRVPLMGRAAEIVRRRLGNTPSGYLFPSIGALGHVEQKAVQTAVHFHQPYSRTRPEIDRPRLTVTHWAPHDLPRTSRTLLASLGCPDSVAEAVLGHMQPGIKGVYNRHAYDQERREWLTRLDGHLKKLTAKAQ